VGHTRTLEKMCFTAKCKLYRPWKQILSILMALCDGFDSSSGLIRTNYCDSFNYRAMHSKLSRMHQLSVEVEVIKNVMGLGCPKNSWKI
jgi:hypothetical protein